MSTIRLGTKFQLKLIILIFGTKFPQKGYFWSETEKLNITIELNIFELAFNHFHGILRLFDVLPNFHFTTCETMCDYYLWKWYIRVASRDNERLQDLSKLGNIREVSKPHRMTAQCPVPLRKSLEKQKLSLSHSALFHMKTRVSLKYLMNDCG